MDPVEILMPPGTRNIVFLGEAGCGKSEIAVNLALRMAAENRGDIHFFDMDMTKPLFRSRDAADLLERTGVQMHFERQFMDAPTLTGGVRPLLADQQCWTILDAGGDYIGARSVGGFSALLNQAHTTVCYVVNPYRPWSLDLEHIDKVLSQILQVSHVRLEKLTFIGNPNLGVRTTADDVMAGIRQIQKTVGSVVRIPLFCANEKLCSALPAELPLMPMTLRLSYEWDAV